MWESITHPDWTERYGYATRTDYELRAGGRFQSLTNQGMRAMGAPDIGVDGEVLEVDPPRRLVQTWRLTMDPETMAEGFTRLTYEIAPTTDLATRLTVTHELTGAPKLAVLVSGGLEEHGAGGGWSWVLSDPKSLLETGSTLASSDH